MTIAKEIVSLAREAAGKVLYAQSRGEDIANVIARALSAAAAAARQDGIDEAIAIMELKLGKNMPTGDVGQ